MPDKAECDALTKEEWEELGNAATRAYGGVEVLIVDRSEGDPGGDTITFMAADPVGDPVKHTEKWGDLSVMWPACPSTLPSNAKLGSPGSPPDIGVSGELYLSQEYMAKTPDLRSTTPKWPTRLPEEPNIAPVKIWPTRIAITGVQLSNGKFTTATIDLLDPADAVIGQSIDANGKAFIVQLTQQGRAKFGLPIAPFGVPDGLLNGGAFTPGAGAAPAVVAEEAGAPRSDGEPARSAPGTSYGEASE